MLLKDRILFGSGFPLITPKRWLKDFAEAGFRAEVQPGILKGNAMRSLGREPPAAENKTGDEHASLAHVAPSPGSATGAASERERGNR